MFRTLIITASFLALFAGLLVLQPYLADTQVADVAATAENEVSRTAANDLSPTVTLNDKVRVAAMGQATDAPADPMRNMTAGVLAGLGVEMQEPAKAEAANPMQAMTSNVLASLGVERKQQGKSKLAQRQEAARLAAANAPKDVEKPVIADVEENRRLENMIVAAIANGNPDKNLDELLLDAANKGLIAVPKGLRTNDGQVDTQTLLLSIIETATGQQSIAQEDLVTGGKGVEVHLVQQADQTIQSRFYTVSKGDSLGMISLKFYGTVNNYNEIFAANRKILSSPDQIRVGQRLVIPNINT